MKDLFQYFCIEMIKNFKKFSTENKKINSFIKEEIKNLIV